MVDVSVTRPTWYSGELDDQKISSTQGIILTRALHPRALLQFARPVFRVTRSTREIFMSSHISRRIRPSPHR